MVGGTGARPAAVLLLGHCAGPLLEPLSAAVRAHGLEPFILTSRPLADAAARRAELGGIAAWFACTDEYDLRRADVRRALAELRAGGYALRCVLSAWEGYRAFMAEANRELGVPDLEPELVVRLLDKLAVRQHLHAHGLSRGTAELVGSADDLARLAASGRRLFLKPVRGIASYGAFALSAATRWDDLRSIGAAAGGDPMFGGLLHDPRYLAEDFIDGRECSFEVLVLAGVPYVVALHEKLDLTPTATTVLESLTASPPWNLDPAAIGAGVDWLAAVLASFAIRWGCFHAEARFDGTRWELIELNPRLGGGLISASVGLLGGGPTMLELWLAALLQPAATRAHLAAIAIDRSGRVAAERATFVRSYPARPGRIAAVRTAAVAHPATLVSIEASAGETIPALHRERYLAELLWAYDPADAAALRPFLLGSSQAALVIDYEPR